MNVETRVFTPKEIEAVRSAIRKAQETADEWRRATKVSRETMTRPLTPPFRRRT